MPDFSIENKYPREEKETGMIFDCISKARGSSVNMC